MDKRPFFSVVTVVRNAASQIERTLESVIGQDMDNYEYIVIDGASTDGTLEIIRRYSDHINYIISEADAGIYNAMNKGLSKASGCYIIFMNAGDCFASETVLSQVALSVHNTTFNLLYGDYIRVSGTGSTQTIPSRTADKIWYGMIASHQSIFYNLDFLRSECLKYDESYRIAADYKLTTEIINRSEPGKIAKLPICISRFELGGISTLDMDRGLAEADRVRKDVLKMPFFLIAIVHVLLLGARVMRENEIFKTIYSRLRY